VAPTLNTLVIRERKNAADILQNIFHIHGYLRELILDGCWLGEDITDLLEKIVDLYPDLEVLSLAHCHPLKSAGYCQIQRLKKLSVLKLSYSEVY
jgi:hypothetical protein